jgi:hypothetical protein
MGRLYSDRGAGQPADFSSSGSDITNVQAQGGMERKPATSNNLPANQAVKDNIRYLGGSYSGSDIRVLVNLYNSADSLDNNTSQLELDREVSEYIVSACNALLNGGIDAHVNLVRNGDRAFNRKREHFLTVAGFTSLGSEAKQKASQRILSTAFNNRNYVKQDEVTQIRLALTGLQSSAQSEIDAIADNIRKNQNSEKTSRVSAVELGTLQTISIQSHREKFGVRGLGKSYVSGYTRGPRTIAGSMIFTIFNEHSFAGLLRALSSTKSSGDIDREISSLLPDQIPPLDLIILFANEYGQLSELRLFGVEILSDGATYSIEDLLSENIMQFVARDTDIMIDKGNVFSERSKRNAAPQDRDLSGTQLLSEDTSYSAYIERLHVRRRLISR